MLRRPAQPDSDQQRPEFVTVQAGGMRLIVQTGPPDMSSG